MKNVAVLGAGCSGLAAIKCCLDEGLEVVCFEQEGYVGGLWNYNEEPRVGRGSVYETLCMNTSKEMISFSDFPPPEDFPAFMPHQYVVSYFKMYADKFNLLQHICFKTSVVKVDRATDYDKSGRWDVTVRCGLTDAIRTETFDGVMVCTGHHTYPSLPHFSGMDLFSGSIMHSHSYRRNKLFDGKRVVVVGIGNSAVDIAVDTSHVASQVFLSTRRGTWVVSRRGPWGLPADAVANSRFMFKLPLWFLQWSVETMSNFLFDHSAYGIKPLHGALESHPTISDELPTCILTGKVKVKPNIKQFEKDGITFEDETYEAIDIVVFATGYNYKIDFLDTSITGIEENQPNLYKYAFPPHLPHGTLSVIGLVQVVGALIPISEMQCRWFTMVLTGKIQLPTEKEMRADIQRKKQEMSVYYPSKRHTIEVPSIEFMDELASIIGVRPNLYRLFWQKPSLAFKCLFGPCVPAQYRLTGPGKWDGAERVIMNAMDNMIKPTRYRQFMKRNSKNGIKWFQWFVVFVCVTNAIFICLLFYDNYI
ncbi:hypothetical protein ScPMuIL_006687 [Solemya velum]